LDELVRGTTNGREIRVSWAWQGYSEEAFYPIYAYKAIYIVIVVDAIYTSNAIL